MEEDQQEVALVEEATAEAVTEQVPEEAATTEDASEPNPESAEQAPDQEDQIRKSRHQRRKEAMERAKRESDELRAKLEAAETRLKEQEEAAGSAKLPQEGDFDTYEQYQAALSGWYAIQQLDGRERAKAEREVEAQKAKMLASQQMQEREIAQGWASQISEAQTRYQDFNDVVMNPNVPISADVAAIIKSMDDGADVAYQLGVNHDLAHQISQLSPVQAAIELGKVAARLSTPKPRTITNAPDPGQPVKAKATASKDPANMTADEYDAWRESGGTF